MKIAVLEGTIRRDRQSVHVARYVHRLVCEEFDAGSAFLDLEAFAIPPMEERVRFRDDSPEGALALSNAIDEADGILVVTPEYNHGIPGVLKNALDYLLPEFKRKPAGIVTVSAGGHGGVRCLEQLRLVLLAMGAVVTPAMLMVPKVKETFTPDGPIDKEAFDKRALKFMAEFRWLAEAVVKAGNA